MDLKKKYDSVAAAEQGAFLHLQYEGKKLYTEGEDKKPIGMILLGRDASSYRDHQKKQTDRRVDQVRISKGGKMKGVKAEATERDAIELTAPSGPEFPEHRLRGRRTGRHVRERGQAVH